MVNNNVQIMGVIHINQTIMLGLVTQAAYIRSLPTKVRQLIVISNTVSWKKLLS